MLCSASELFKVAAEVSNAGLEELKKFSKRANRRLRQVSVERRREPGGFARFLLRGDAKPARSHLRRRRRGGRSHAPLRASDFSSWLRPIGLAFAPLMPVRSYQRWLRGIFLRSRPPLLIQGGDCSLSIWRHAEGVHGH